MVNPLMEAIERLTNPYAIQERIYRNRVDDNQARLQVLASARVNMVRDEQTETVTPLEVIVIRDADHLREVLDSATHHWTPGHLPE